MSATPAILLVVALAGLALFLKRDLAVYRRFKTLTDSRARRRQFRAWIAITFVLFVGYTMVTLALLGRFGDLVRMPAEFAPVAALFADAGMPAGHDAGSLVLGMVIGMAAVVVGGLVLARRRKRPVQPKTVGDFEALLPRNPAELAHAAALSINAGLTEELFFRLALPLLFALVTGNAWFAFAAATIIFGIAHLYQGITGVLATTFAGLLLAAVYLMSGSLWAAVALHIAIDLVGLVIRPLLGGVVRAEPAG